MIVVDAREHDVIAVEKLSDLIELAQFGTLEIHVRGSRLGRLELCDRIVFDLDPGEDVGWEEIVTAAGDPRAAQRAEAEELCETVGWQRHPRGCANHGC